MIIILFQHLYEFVNHIHEYNYLMFDPCVAKNMNNVEDVLMLKEKKKI